MKKRAISEILSAIIIIVVVVAGIGLYTGLSQQRILGDTLSVKENIEQQDQQVSEMLEFIDMFEHETETDVIRVYVHNFGLKNITMTDVFVNGTINMTTNPNSFHVRDLGDNIIIPNNRTIPVGKTSEIVLDFGGVESPTKVSSVVIRTDSNKIIQILNNTE